MKLITTSWDDGHVLDFKLADLLQKYNLPATFYIPRSNPERPVMSEAQVKSLAGGFEIGGHGLHHLRLHSKSSVFLNSEITGSYNWLSDLLGKAPLCFCFPGGVYNQTIVDTVFNNGYKLARGVELLSTMPVTQYTVATTTLQAYPHPRFTYIRHLLKRRRWLTLLSWLKDGSEAGLVQLANHHLSRVSENGGCFHLWGHSWEIEKYDLWKPLETLFRVIANRPGFSYDQNKALLEVA